MEEFDTYEFECLLQDDFFNGNELSVIKKMIKSRLKADSEFKEQYERWIDESGFESWREFYDEDESSTEAAWDSMFPEGDEDDSITDYLTKE